MNGYQSAPGGHWMMVLIVSLLVITVAFSF